MPKPQKIFIIGIAGSGKTTLARRLARELGYPHIDLDTIRYPKTNTKILLPEIRPIMDELIEEAVWIIEGVYTGWTAPLLQAADCVIWLDTGAWRSAYRILRRHTSHHFQGRRRHSHKSTLELARQVVSADRQGIRELDSEDDSQPWRQEIELALTPHREKVIHVTTLRQARSLRLEGDSG